MSTLEDVYFLKCFSSRFSLNTQTENRHLFPIKRSFRGRNVLLTRSNIINSNNNICACFEATPNGLDSVITVENKFMVIERDARVGLNADD